MKAIDVVAAVLVIVGGLNWGLVGAFNFNLVAALFGQSVLASSVYVAVGVAAAYQAARLATAARPVLAHA